MSPPHTTKGVSSEIESWLLGTRCRCLALRPLRERLLNRLLRLRLGPVLPVVYNIPEPSRFTANRGVPIYVMDPTSSVVQKGSFRGPANPMRWHSMNAYCKGPHHCCRSGTS